MAQVMLLQWLVSCRHSALIRWGWRLGLAASAISIFAFPSSVAAQEMDVPVAIQIPLFLKVVTFDRQVHSRGRGEFVIAVAYQSGNRASAGARDEAVRALDAARATVAGAPVRVVSIDLDHERLADALKDSQTSLLYVTPLRGVDIGALATTAGTAGVTTVSGVTRYVELGLAVGVRLQRDRPKIMINVKCARQQGADFAAELLKLAEVLQ